MGVPTITGDERAQADATDRNGHALTTTCFWLDAAQRVSPGAQDFTNAVAVIARARSSSRY
jgi:hypothetical protein